MRYYDLNGNKSENGFLPSVTTIVKETKSEKSKQILEKWRKNNPEATRVLERGKEIDGFIWDFFNDDSQESERKLKNHYLGYQLLPFIKKLDCIAQEKFVYHGRNQKPEYAGKFDMLAFYDDVPIIIDWKTSTKPKQSNYILDYFLQISAYREALKNYDLVTPEKSVIAIAVENAQKPQFFIIDHEQHDYYYNQFLERVDLFYGL